MKTAIGYVRISTEDQSSFSIPYQVDQITEYCQKNNYNLVEIFKDEGQSGKNFDRKNWKNLDKFLKGNKNKVDVLIVFKYNRFSRNLKDALNVIHQLEEVYGITLLSVSEPLPLDPENPFFFQFRVNMLLQAHSEWLMIRDNTVNGMRKAKSLGCYLGNAPFGYKNSRTNDNLSTLEIDEEKAAIVKKIFELYIIGWNFKKIAEFVKELGFKRSGRSAIKRVLQNHVYAGLINKNIGKEESIYIKAIHEAIIDPDVFHSIQNRLRSPERTNLQANENAWLKRMISCPDCGRIMTCSRSKGRSAYYWYYECSVHRKGYPINKAHKIFEDILAELDLNHTQLKYLEEQIKLTLKEHLFDSREKLPILKKKFTEIKTKIQTLNEKYFEAMIDDSTYIEYKNKYTKESKKLESEIKLITVNEKKVMTNIFENFEKLVDIKSTFEAADIYQKQNFIQIGFGNSITFDGDIYRTAYLNPIFLPKALLLNKKRLMEYKPFSGYLDKVPLGVADGIRTHDFQNHNLTL